MLVNFRAFPLDISTTTQERNPLLLLHIVSPTLPHSFTPNLSQVSPLNVRYAKNGFDENSKWMWDDCYVHG
jgi:hypothetical protein